MKKNNLSITDIFKPNDNYKFSNLYGDDLQEFLVLLDDMFIEYRDSLNFTSPDTFGVELEFADADINSIGENLINGWILKKETSLNNGSEVVSPILKDEFCCWNDLDKMCSLISSNASIKENCGSHIHFGVQSLGTNIESWINFIKLFSIYENIIYRFSYGEFLSYRNSIRFYALPVALNFYKIYILYNENKFDIDALIYKLKFTRQQAVNFCNVDVSKIGQFYNKNTIEFRCPNGTLDPIIWQNNINFFMSLIKYCNSSKFDHDILNKRYELVFNKMSNLLFYNEIYISQALELSDLIFDKNIDKLYFLRQYFKSFDISSDYTRAKEFTKKRC